MYRFKVNIYYGLHRTTSILMLLLIIFCIWKTKIKHFGCQRVAMTGSNSRAIKKVPTISGLWCLPSPSSFSHSFSPYLSLFLGRLANAALFTPMAEKIVYDRSYYTFSLRFTSPIIVRLFYASIMQNCIKNLIKPLIWECFLYLFFTTSPLSYCEWGSI